MTTYQRLMEDLARYRSDWPRALHVTDLATWLGNWRGDELTAVYVAAIAEKKAAKTLEQLALAGRIANAAFVAMDGETAKKVVMDPHYKVLLDFAIDERRNQSEG